MLGSALGAAGLILTLVGTFLPWLVSGGVERNSYAIVGIVGRLGLVGNGFGSTALSLWPTLGPVAMVAIIAGILRWWRTAAAITLLFGALTGVIGAGVLAVAGGHAASGIYLDHKGPTVMVVGAGCAVAGAVTVLIARRNRRNRIGSVQSPAAEPTDVAPRLITRADDDGRPPTGDARHQSQAWLQYESN
jgi:hypothetical protein